MADIRKLTRRTSQPHGIAGMVQASPATADDPLTVAYTLRDSDGSEEPAEEGPLRWASNGRMPLAEDDALLLFDDQGDPWALVWGTGGPT
jgi:hypothetical protein